MCDDVIVSLTNVCVNAIFYIQGGIVMSFSERLVLLRKSNGLTQKKLAEEMELSELAIQNYESQRRKPAFDVLIALADYFDVSLDYLVGRSEDPKRY